MRTKLPARLNNAVATRTVTFETVPAFGTTQKRLFHITAAPGALFFSVVFRSAEKDDNSNGQEGKKQKPEKGAVIKITAMPNISPGTRHCVYLG